MIRFGGPILLPDEPVAGRSQSHGARTDDVDALVRRHVEKGYRAAYAPEVSIDDGERIRAIRDAFERAGITIAEVQCWNNLLVPDEQQRSRHREDTVTALALADELGAVCALNTVGSFAAQSLNHHHPDNFSDAAFDAAVENARHIIDSARPRRARFAYEVLAMHLVDGPEILAELVAAVDRPAFAVHLDLVNLVSSPRRYWANGLLARECVRHVGAHIVAAHAKDVIMEDNCDTVRISETRPGTGRLDYSTYLSCLHELPQQVTLLMEHLESEAEYDAAAAYIRDCAASTGVTL